MNSIRRAPLSRACRVVAAAVTLSALTAPAVVGQAEPEVELERTVSPQIWVDYNPSVFLSPKVNLYGDIGFRTELQSEGWWRLVIRPNILYSVSNSVRLGGGLNSFNTFNQEIADRWELRAWQGATAVWPRWRVPLDHRLKLEERFDFDTRTWDSRNSLRLRYRLRGTFRWGAFLQDERSWRALLSLEVFATLAGQQGQFREQARLAAGIERSVSREVTVRIEAAWQKEGQALFIGRGEVDDLFLRVRVFQNW